MSGAAKLVGIMFAFILLANIIDFARTEPASVALIAGGLALALAAAYVLVNPLILPRNRRLLAEKSVKFVDTLGLNDPSDINQRLLGAATVTAWSAHDIETFTSDVERTLIEAIALTKIEPHLATLRRKKAQNTYKDDYGIQHNSGWLKECNYFVTAVLLPLDQRVPQFISKVTQRYVFLTDAIDRDSIETWVAFLDDLVAADDSRSYLSDLTSMTGHDYETFVGNIVEDCGWGVLVTKGSGDQGADVIAERDGVRIVMQCKLYASTVGNKAVQEVFAAKVFYDCDDAWVVSNAAYTPSARKVAARTGVTLLHHDEIPELLEDLERFTA